MKVHERRSPTNALALIGSIALVSCRTEPPSEASADAVGRCTAGMKRALKAGSRGEALQTYQRACSDLFEDAACRDVLKKASGTVSGDWLRPSLSACATAYCPVLSTDIKACRTGPVEGPGAIDQNWIELSHAILRRRDERGAGDVVFASARFFADLNAHMPPRLGTHGVSPAVVEHCERGIETARTLPSRRERRSTYYKECAFVYEKECHAAFRSAAGADPERQEPIVLVGCRKTYCPWFAPPSVEACDGEFVPTRDAVTRAWPALHRAILDLDAPEYADRLIRAVSSLDENGLKDGGRAPAE
jgi:hypothetical protein